MDAKILKLLEKKDQDESVSKLLSYLKTNLKRSRQEMGKRYETWDKNLDIYRGIRPRDAEDAKAADKEEPEKMVVPMSFAQIQTFSSFCYLLFTQNEHVYEFAPTGNEDYSLRDVSELTIERDLRKNKFNSLLVQFLLDIGRFGMGVFKTTWVEEKISFPQSDKLPEFEQDGQGMLVQLLQGLTGPQEYTKYEGNKIIAVSPYKFLPDTRLPLTRWSEGQFAADETEWHINELKKWESAGSAVGIEFVEEMNASTLKERGPSRFDNISGKRSKDPNDFMVCVTEVQVWLTPKDYKSLLGDSDVRQMYVVRIANDHRIIAIEPMGNYHGEFSYDLGMFLPDQHQTLSDALSDVIGPLQDYITFLLNSRLVSTRRNLVNNLVVDPSFVDMSTVESGSPFIMLKKNAPKVGVDKFISQLKTTDATQTHVSDAQMLMGLMQTVTGVNENAMGQFHGGRRSATEARAVNAGSAARMKVIASTIWSDCLAPLGLKLLCNQRQNMTQETFAKIVGDTDPELLSFYDQFCPQDIGQLIGSEDFFVFDATLSSEKGFIAQSLQDLVVAMLGNPEVLQMLQLDVGAMIKEVQSLRGQRNLSRFKIQPPPYANPIPVESSGTPGAPAAAGNLPSNPALPLLSAGSAG